jgi:hypothetical protein
MINQHVVSCGYVIRPLLYMHVTAEGLGEPYIHNNEQACTYIASMHAKYINSHNHHR